MDTVNRSHPSSINFHQDLAAMLGLQLPLVLTVYLGPFPALGTTTAQAAAPPEHARNKGGAESWIGDCQEPRACAMD